MIGKHPAAFHEYGGWIEKHHETITGFVRFHDHGGSGVELSDIDAVVVFCWSQHMVEQHMRCFMMRVPPTVSIRTIDRSTRDGSVALRSCCWDRSITLLDAMKGVSNAARRGLALSDAKKEDVRRQSPSSRTSSQTRRTAGAASILTRSGSSGPNESASAVMCARARSR